ncbi:MAG: hypothetical protein ACJAS1_006482, partial [Oleiphilaceae bacterium]
MATELQPHEAASFAEKIYAINEAQTKVGAKLLDELLKD